MAEATLLSTVRVVARKELVEIMRDKRSLFVLLLLPVALYPMMLVGFVFLSTSNMRKLAAKKHTVWVEGLEHLPPSLRERLERQEDDDGNKELQLVLAPPPTGADYDQALSHKKVTAILRGVPREVPETAGPDPPEVEIFFNSGHDVSVIVQRRILTELEAWKAEIVEQRLARASLSKETLEPLELKSVDKGPPGAVLAGFLAMMLIVLASSGAFYPALDLGAGEKERGTLETLLLAPVPRVAVAMGKFVAVFVVTFASAVLHLLSLGGTFASFTLMAPGQLSIQPNLWLLPVMLLVLLPLVALFSALALALATFAASYKEGQSYMTPVLLLGTLPAMAAALPGMELTPAMSLVPVLGSTLLTKALLSDTYTVGQIVLVTVSTFMYAGLAVRWVATLYGQEEVLWRPAAAKSPDIFGFGGDAFGKFETPTLPQAVALAVLGLLLLWFVAKPLQAKWLAPGLAITLLVFVAVPAVAYARMLGCHLRRTFRLAAPSPLAFVAALLLAIGCLGVILDVVTVQQMWTGAISEKERKLTEEAFRGLLDLGPVLVILLMAVLPGICEELMFRGFILTGLRREGGTVGPVLVTALLFAIFHLDPGRLLPTFLLGCVMGFVVVRSGSIFPAMLMHVLYNASLFGLDSFGPQLMDAGLLAGPEEPTWLLRGIGIAGLVLGSGLLLAVRPVKIGGEVPEPPPPVPPGRRAVIALPSQDFDPTEVSVPWDTLRKAGVEVVFATEDGKPAACDPLLITGVVFGQLGAEPENVALYKELVETSAFKAPMTYADIDPTTIDALVLPGGHAQGMKPYLESKALQDVARACLTGGVIVGAICHGVLVLARAQDPATGASILNGRRVTALTKVLEGAAYALTFWKLGRYYRTYPAYVQDEVSVALGDRARFDTGPLFASYDNPFHVEDGNLITARWPGDASGFATALLEQVRGRRSAIPGTEPSGQ